MCDAQIPINSASVTTLSNNSKIMEFYLKKIINLKEIKL